MPLPPPPVVRQTLHHRDIAVRGYKRADGLFDIEGHLQDTKELEFRVASGLRKAGEPIHSMWLRITIDNTFTIVDADAASDAMPYEGYCNTITPDYKKLVGLAIRPGFSNKVKELLKNRTRKLSALPAIVTSSTGRRPTRSERAPHTGEKRNCISE